MNENRRKHTYGKRLMDRPGKIADNRFYGLAFRLKRPPHNGGTMKKAILFGASGFIGSFILQDLLEHPEYEQITVVMRKNPGIEHPKLKILIGDRASLPGLAGEIECDEVFVALGTTKKKTPDQAEYYAIDHDYPVLAASVAKERGAKSVFLVSSVGANEKSGVFYTRTKGEAERDIIALGLEHTHIFRPSILMGDRPEQRPLEKMLITACAALNPLLVGSFRRYRGIPAKDVAKAMVSAAERPAGKVAVYEWDAIQALLA